MNFLSYEHMIILDTARVRLLLIFTAEVVNPYSKKRSIYLLTTIAIWSFPFQTFNGEKQTDSEFFFLFVGFISFIAY